MWADWTGIAAATERVGVLVTIQSVRHVESLKLGQTVQPPRMRNESKCKRLRNVFLAGLTAAKNLIGTRWELHLLTWMWLMVKCPQPGSTELKKATEPWMIVGRDCTERPRSSLLLLLSAHLITSDT